VRFFGAVSGAGTAVLLARPQMLVLASYSENFGNVVLEAMAAGTPVVVTEEVGVAELVLESGAGLVCAGAPNALGGAIASLAADADRRREWGARGRAFVAERLTWDAVARQMEQLYETVARRPC
jgi:glycosyltransferase involved in cell wall biosynthesis